MSRSDQEQRDAENAESAARRARRLADRAELRAHRKAQSAREAAERADRLAARAGTRRGPRGRELENSIEDYVDKVAESLTRKATDWLDGADEDAVDDTYGDTYEDSYEDTYGSKRDDRSASAAERSTTGSAGHRARAEARRARRRARRHGPSFLSRFRSGKTIYRDKARGKVLGVCAGMADYLEVEIWQVRLFALLGLLFVGSVTLPVYFILYFLMDDKPYYRKVADRFEDEAELHGDRRYADGAAGHSKAADSRRSTRSNVQLLRTAKGKFADIEARVRSMESHVTSSRFELQREIRKIAGDEL